MIYKQFTSTTALVLEILRCNHESVYVYCITKELHIIFYFFFCIFFTPIPQCFTHVMCVMQARVVCAHLVCPRAFVLRAGPVLVCGEFFFFSPSTKQRNLTPPPPTVQHVHTPPPPSPPLSPLSCCVDKTPYKREK